jgi:hypothetical protein
MARELLSISTEPEYPQQRKTGGPAMSKINICEEKVEKIKAMLRGRVNDLQVFTREGCVVLLGKASSYHAKQLAQHHVFKLLGVPNLVNEIEVQPAFFIDPFCTGSEDKGTE